LTKRNGRNDRNAKNDQNSSDKEGTGTLWLLRKMTALCIIQVMKIQIVVILLNTISILENQKNIRRQMGYKLYVFK
jgi:hypothetical protein